MRVFYTKGGYKRNFSLVREAKYRLLPAGITERCDPGGSTTVV
jgi:hypothetical protein